MAQRPNSGRGDGGGYQILSSISQNTSSSNDSDYDYPADPTVRVVVLQQASPISPDDSRLQLVPQPEAAYANTHAMSQEAGGIQLGALDSVPCQLLGDHAADTRVVQDSLSSSEADSSGPEASVAQPSVVRQVLSGPRPRTGAMDNSSSARVVSDGGNDEKLFLTGNLMDCHQRVGSPVESEFADEGIYQGLVMTDKQKRHLGILPESLYMTVNLMEKGDLIESMSLSIPATAVEVPEVPLPPDSPSIFGKPEPSCLDTTPRIAPPPKPPRRGEKG